MRLLRRRVTGDLSTRIDDAYFGEIRRLVPLGRLRAADAEGIVEAHRQAWDVVRADVFHGSTPAVMFGSRQTAIEVERAHLAELGGLFGAELNELNRVADVPIDGDSGRPSGTPRRHSRG